MNISPSYCVNGSGASAAKTRITIIETEALKGMDWQLVVQEKL